MDLARGAEPVILERLSRHKVVVLEGARAVGKTTLARKIAGDLGGSYLDLSDHAIRAAVEADPQAVLAARTTPVVVDEAQLIETLTLDVKRIVDERREPGQFLLTGSSRVSRGSLGGSDPLAGRASRVTLHPLTVAERSSGPINTVRKWLDGPPTPATVSPLDHETLLRLIIQGGQPAQVTAQPASTSAARWWSTSAETMPAYLDSAVSLLFGKYDADRSRLIQAIRYLAANPSQILNVSRMASDLSISRDTARRYIDMLTDSLLVHLLPSVRPAAHKTIASHPKLAVFDTAFAAWAAAVPPGALLFDGRVWGGLVENLAVLETLAQAGWAGPGIGVGHWREGADEVDLIVTDLDGSVIGIEVKAAKTASHGDTRGLRALQRRLGARFRFGIVLYTGAGRYPIEGDHWAVPLSDLWAPID